MLRRKRIQFFLTHSVDISKGFNTELVDELCCLGDMLIVDSSPLVAIVDRI